jgi:hypothetical protein
MKWFRSNIKHGTRLALIALAINLGLSFGHIHAIDGKRAGSGLASLVATVASTDGGQTQGHHDDSHTDDLCAICMAATAMGNVVASTPPALPQQFAEASIDRTIESDLAVPKPPRAAFQSRGPPIS